MGAVVAPVLSGATNPAPEIMGQIALPPVSPNFPVLLGEVEFVAQTNSGAWPGGNKTAK